ncbi:MAG: class III poly(R)-hydroxyalkanoic acid synthase subunit PhaE [Luteimonas sp.]
MRSSDSNPFGPNAFASNPFASNPFGSGQFGSADFESLARQYWGAWGEAMRGAVPGAAQANASPWQDAVDWWSKFAHGGRQEANDAVSRFNQQARQWFGQMQQVAAQYAGQDAGAADIARAWKEALGAAGENPFPEMFRAMRGQGQQGLEQWIEDTSPYLDAFQRESASWLRMPAFGLGREHQERVQKLVQAQMEYQQQNSAYNALMAKAGQSAYEIFERKLTERSAPGKQIESSRALFDLWIDAAEEAYAQIALSPEFRAVYGKLVNAQMRLRSGIQREVEQVSAMFGMPTRTEVDGAYRKIAELERSLRKLRDAAETHDDQPSRSSPPRSPPKASIGKQSKPVREKPQQDKPSQAKADSAKQPTPQPTPGNGKRRKPG